MSDQQDPAETREVDPDAITGALEALLLMATEPMSTAELAQALDVPKPVVWDALDRLRDFYDETHRGFELREVGQGWRYYTRPEHHDVIAAWLLEGQHARLSQAALETLAVVAYLQPISRSRVGAIRGVNVDGVMRTLVARELVEESARDEETGAMLFRTTDYFLERMGMTGLDELPPLAPHLPEASLLEAELSGLASSDESAILDATEQREPRKGDAMTDNLIPEDPTTTPTGDSVSPEEAAKAAEIPEPEELERLETPDSTDVGTNEAPEA
ncbi:SMC-Scp complex subunit ScpB [Nigerium massiliense]|uniref:SMC-Scp complex subunit ScpB n=1 Tax=Nigerium massiliense TaxID=1522317 RepID=UPI000907C14A|nr:SMC-Scp complex subunit ScpB [Nigerium massiliense]